MEYQKITSEKKVFRANVNGGGAYFGVLAKNEGDAVKEVLKFLLKTDASELNYDSFDLEVEDLEVPAPTEENPVVRE